MGNDTDENQSEQAPARGRHEFAEVFVASSQAESAVIQSLLESYGVEAWVEGQVSGLNQLAAFSRDGGGVSILVDQNDLARARDIIKSAPSEAQSGQD